MAWLVPWLAAGTTAEGNRQLLDKPAVESGAALLMNLVMRREVARQCEDVAVPLLQLCGTLLGEPSAQVCVLAAQAILAAMIWHEQYDPHWLIS